MTGLVSFSHLDLVPIHSIPQIFGNNEVNKGGFMATKNSHCSFCGTRFSELPWPRKCASCDNMSYLNPTPVAVIVLPVDNGVLTVRRAYGSKAGQLALPGGFIDMGESWQEAAARELFEETGITISAKTVDDFRVRSAPDGTVLVFGLAAKVKESDLPPFQASTETTERVIVRQAQDLAFPLHTEVLNQYFSQA